MKTIRVMLPGSGKTKIAIHAAGWSEGRSTVAGRLNVTFEGHDPAVVYSFDKHWLSIEEPTNKSSPQRIENLPLIHMFQFFMDCGTAQSAIGDLQEKFAILVSTKGKHNANQWYRRQIIICIAPLFWAQLKRSFGITRLVEWYRKMM
jgi:hypothetical protein